MANRIIKKLTSALIVSKNQQIRHAHHLKGPPNINPKNLQQKLAELNYKDPAVYYTVDIGFTMDTNYTKSIKAAIMKEYYEKKKDTNLAKLSLSEQLKIDLDEVKKDWYQIDAPKHLKKLAEHYAIFNDLYGDAYFYPVVPLTINYEFGNEEYIAQVYNGNIVKPFEATNSPSVSYVAPEDSLWTLLMTTPDGNYSDPNIEYCHWFIGNIPGNDISKGEQLVDYLRPIPCRGSGYYRYIFVLYKQNKRLDLSEYKKEQPCLNLVERNWSTYDFYRKYQDDITPAGLAFFQSDWDNSTTEFYHHTLNMKEPYFEYDFPKHYLRNEKWFPKKEPFDVYLDMFRDPKDINKEMLVRKLRKTHPFNGPEKPLKYPACERIDNFTVPSWLKTRLVKERSGVGNVTEIA